MQDCTFKQVRKFKYLGCVLVDDKYCGTEIQMLIELTKYIFQELTEFISMKTLRNCYIISVLEYAIGCWKIFSLTNKMT